MTARESRSASDAQPGPTRRRLLPARWGETTAGPARSAISAVLHRDGLLLLVPAALIVALLIIGWWTRDALDESIGKSLEAQLTSVVDADVAALELWVEDQRRFSEAWARNEDLDEAIATLAEAARAAPEARSALLESPALADVTTLLEHAMGGGDFTGFVVIDAGGLILAADAAHRQFVGDRISAAGMAPLSGVLDGASAVIRPYRQEDMVAGAAPKAGDLDAFAVPVTRMMFSAAPIREEDGRVTGVLAFLVDPEETLTHILSVARPGETGETYAFNRDGYLLSGSRFETALVAAGLLPEKTDEQGYAILLRDPGGDLTKGYVPDEPLSTRPLTKMAASGTAGFDGVNVDGYRDYRGIPVVGAWRWLEEYDFGVATEMDRTEAYRPMRAVRTAFIALIALLVGASGVILGATYLMRSFAHRIDEVRELGQYRLVRLIGEGGMGSVYLAQHAMLQRPTALKTLKPDALSKENIARFEREVQLTSRLSHPNTIAIYDFGRTPEGQFYYAMEYLHGFTLADLIEMEGPIPAARIVYILKQVCGSLEEAHDDGLLHRDIKPPNIMLCQRGLQTDVAKVLDFGLVKEIKTPKGRQVTQVGIVGGTPPYIAPERLSDPDCMDPRSDLFSLGAVAYAMMTGRETFEGESAMDVCTKVLLDTPPAPSKLVSGTTVSPQLEALVMSTLSIEPKDRPASAAAMIARLDAIDDAGVWTQNDSRVWWADNRDRIERETGAHFSEPDMSAEAKTVVDESP